MSSGHIGLGIIMKKLNTLLLTSCALALAGCETTDRGPAAAIIYRMPETKAHLTLTMSVEGCAATGIALRPNLTTTFSAVAGSKPYRIDGSDLTSAWISRQLTIELNTSGTLKSINAVNTDKTADIIKNTVSFATNAAKAGIFTSQPRVAFTCNKATANSFDRIQVYKTKIYLARGVLAGLDEADLNSKLPPDLKPGPSLSADDKKDLGKQIEAWAKEVARIKTDELSLSLETDLDLSARPTKVAVVAFDYNLAVNKWVDTSSLAGSVKVEDLSAALLLVAWSAKKVEGQEDRKSKKACTVQIDVPAAELETFQLELMGALYPRKNDRVTSIVETVPVAQWSEPEKLCLDAQFAEKTDIQLTFDDFGRKTKFVWSSGARGEEVTAAASGVSKSLGEYAEATEGETDLEAQKREIDALKTQQELNRLRACKEILAAGGFDCPK